MSAVLAPGGYEPLAFRLGQRVHIRGRGQLGIVRGFYAWEPPIVQVFVQPDDGGQGEWLSQSDVEAVQ